MAVVITTKFYQDSTWKDISKVVFTSPNMVSPSVAGTRSHILPGEGDLGTWYEDTSQMFRIEDNQWSTSTDFYNLQMQSKIEVDLTASPTYIDVVNTNYDGLHTYIKENSGVEAISYEDLTGYITGSQTKLEYTLLQENLSEITNTSESMIEYVLLETTKQCLLAGWDEDDISVYGGLEGGLAGGLATIGPPPELPTGYYTSADHTWYRKYEYRNFGWFTPVIAELPECYIVFTFSEPTKITAVSLDSLSYQIIEEQYDFVEATKGTGETTCTAGLITDCYPEDEYGTLCQSISDPDVTEGTAAVYYIGNFVIEGSGDKETWTQLFSGSNTSNTTKIAYLSNNSYWTYYRIRITDNDTLSGAFDTDYYGLRNVRFYTYEYSTEAGTDSVAVYQFNDKDDPKIIKVGNATPVAGTTLVTTVESDVDTSVVGRGFMSTISGSPYYSSYSISLNELGDAQDFLTAATCVATTVSGLGIDTDATTYLLQDKIAMEVYAETEITAVSGSPGYADMVFTAYGYDDTLTVSTADWVGTAKIEYTTVASGTTAAANVHDYTLTGTTTRTYTTYLYPKRESYRLTIDEVTTASGVLAQNDWLYIWGYDNVIRPLDMDTSNSIIFEVTTGEAYNCRLTAWDDVTHSTLGNELIAGDHARVSAVAYCGGTGKLDPSVSTDPINLIYPPVHNRILKGDTVYLGSKYYYGDFDLVYRYQTDVYGDYLAFRPMLYGVDSSLSYGVHDFIVTLHYSYT